VTTINATIALFAQIGRRSTTQGEDFLKTTLRLILLVLVCGIAPARLAQQFPAKEVQIIRPYAPGGATDLVFRALAASTQKYLGKAVVVASSSRWRSAPGNRCSRKHRMAPLKENRDE
jgi:hypothetical protein